MVVEAFFWRGRSDPPEEIENLPNLLLLSGPPSSGKTSLLFQFAFHVAVSRTSSTTSNVFFICNRHKLDSKPPFLSQGIDASSDVFHRIQMKYVNDDEDINKYFAAFHLYDVLPAAVIIDDFGDFFDNRICQERHSNPRGRDLAMVRSLALCHNAITYANQKGSCKLLLSDTYHGDSPRLHFIYKKWIPSIFTIKEGDETGSFILKGRSSSGTQKPDRTKVAKYSIALQYLFLERIIEDQTE
ncbi:uncharacterized protein LOC129314271 [Prosopis cineraria]|uniref:uncharacterized protein LOC129314271 n=1 Tax=Prosopis cineraria TaxID=364024 RepID=UPI0024100628|nr:uncharacterized protein LOC129314271 [Prosopis cineraria]